MKKFKIAIDIDDCVCNTWEADMNWAYIYAKNNNIELFSKQVDLKNFRYCEVSKVFKFNEKQTCEFFTNEKKHIMKKIRLIGKE